MEPRFSVAEFNDLINKTLQAVGDVIIEGEITQINISSKGGLNIVIKDPRQNAVLNLSGYAPRIEGLQLIKEGMRVAAWGVPSLWSQGGKFSLSIYKILPLGEGALKEAYEKLKQELAAAGLFADERKRPLPELITRIALVTAKDSAAQSDFFKILKENKAGFAIDFYPVQVQGKYAEMEILAALKYINTQDYDCVVLVRGGGSLEDLITFNSDKLARMLFSMRMPVVVGVGHEKDESIADYVADIRASTPSQAAYYLASNNLNFITKQENKAEGIKDGLEARLDGYQLGLRNRTSGLAQKLLLQLQKIRAAMQKLQFLSKQLPLLLQSQKEKVQSLERILESVNPANVLKKGFSIVKTGDGKVITSSEQVKPGDEIGVTLNQGNLLANILKTNND